jgi:hypothetical protein
MNLLLDCAIVYLACSAVLTVYFCVAARRGWL